MTKLPCENEPHDYGPGHPLRGVPPHVLQAAREVTREAATWNDVDPDIADALADAVLAAAMCALTRGPNRRRRR